MRSAMHTTAAAVALFLAFAAGAAARPQAYSAPLGLTHMPKPLAAAVGGAPDEPVGGDIWPVAIYWCEVGIGNPPVMFPVAIDSGSYTLDVPRKGCTGCVSKPPNAAYDPSASSTSINNNQPFSNSYQTCDLKDPTAVCTITGEWYTDEVTLAGAGPANVSFGAIETQTTNFDQFKNIDGVMGMAGGSGETNTFTQLVAAGAFSHDVWAICMMRGAKSNGTITFGGTDERLYTGAIEYVSNPYGNQFYGVNTPQMAVQFKNGTSAVIENTQSSSILDTGTNVLLLPTAPFNSVVAIFKSTCADGGTPLHGICGDKTILDGKTCLPYTKEQIAAFPDVAITLSPTLTLMTYGTDYILRHPTDDGLYCFGIRVSSTGGYQIIGDTTMKNYYQVFDRESNRIGYAPVSDKCGNI